MESEIDERRSQSLRREVTENHAMGNDVELLHSQGDEPDLKKYLRDKSEKE